MRSVFGDQILPLRTDDDVKRLRRKGIKLRDFDGPNSIQNERLLYESGSETLLRNVLELLPKNASSIERVGRASKQSMDVLLDVIFHAKENLTCFEPAPTEQIQTFVKLLFESALFQTAFPIVSPVCPDYGESGYRLKDGLSETAKRSIDAFTSYQKLFTKHGVTPKLTIHLADVEATDPTVLTATGETTESFTAKLQGTHESIQDYIEKKGLTDQVSVTSMLAFCEEQGIEYGAMIVESTDRILTANEKKIRSVYSRLLADRMGINEYAGITQVSPEFMAANELAGYSVYGTAVNASAFIASPDAKSAVPAYNFFQDRNNMNATAYVKREKGQRI